MINTTSNISQSRSGASATIRLSLNDFDACIPGDGGDAGPSAWVAITPKPTGGPIDPTQIMQVGIIECRGGWPNDACHGENNPHFFWAYGGCVPFIPKAQDMGPADYSTHTYAMWLQADGWWHFSIDGAPQGTAKHKILSNSTLSCWTNDMRAARWQYERWDWGDSIGSSSPNQRSYVSNARYGTFNGGWHNPLWSSSGACSYDEANSFCGTTGSDSFWVYNVN